MAKRKRLTPAQGAYLDQAVPAQGAGLPPMAPAPIAQVAGEASARAALEDLTQAMETARASGRLIEEIPLAQIDEHYLVRDRLVQDEDEMTALMDSLRARGQQTPIELVRLPDPVGEKRFGLISGWRRLTALKRLNAAGDGAGFAVARAQIIMPETAQDAYVAMVEENEIRVNLSHYERARIAVRALAQGVYDSQRSALQGLYGSTTRSKRSKIGSFVTLVDGLDDVLRHPTAISEKLGLDLVREISRDAGALARLRDLLRGVGAIPAEEEMLILRGFVAAAAAQLPEEAETPAPSPAPQPALPADRITRALPDGLHLRFAPGKIELSGERVDLAFLDALEAWLKGQSV